MKLKIIMTIALLFICFYEDPILLGRVQSNTYVEPYLINLSEEYAFDQGVDTGYDLMTLLYSKTNIKFKIDVYPTDRGLNYVNSGYLDAELGRYSQVMENYPNTIQIPEPLVTTKIGIFCIVREACDDPDSFMIVPKGFIFGLNYCNKNYKACLVVFNDVNSFKALKVGTGDALLGTFLTVTGVMCAIDFADTVYYREVESLESSIYHYVNVKNKHLVPVLDRTLKDAKADGSLQKIFDTYNSKILECDVIPISLDSKYLELQED